MIVKKICNFLSTIILIVLLAAALVIVVPMILGYKEMAVLSGSMEPTIPVGSLLYVKEMDASQLEVGDVCTYYLDSETFVTHRVISVDEASSTLVTQGDANEDPDPAISFDAVYGRADFHLPWLGYVTMNIKTSNGIMAICGVLVVVLLLNFIPAIIDAGEEDKAKEKAKEEPSKTE